MTRSLNPQPAPKGNSKMKILISKKELSERCGDYEYVFHEIILKRGRVNHKQIPAYDPDEIIELTEKELNQCGMLIGREIPLLSTFRMVDSSSD